MEYLIEITVNVDDDEVATIEQEKAKKKQIRQAIESIDPSIGVFIVENFN